MGFCWDPQERDWKEAFEKLCLYKKVNGNCDVPQHYKDHPSLGTWVSNQRLAKSKGNLTTERVKRLEELGFCWDSFERDWEEAFEKLCLFRKANGHCDVPKGYKDDPSLATWVNNQRATKKKGKLATEKKKKLDEIGFCWALKERDWEEAFEKIRLYKEENGHCDVPAGYKDDPTLGRWVSNQRKTKKKGDLTTERIKRLEELDFCWDPQERDWEESFEKLRLCQAVNGNCNMPRTYKDDPGLVRWVGTQRKAKNKGKLTTEREKRLNEIGFCWNLLERDWEQAFEKLRLYKEEKGNCNVPKGYKDDPSLATWVSNQRATKKKGKLATEKKKKLDEISFCWDLKERGWEESFD